MNNTMDPDTPTIESLTAADQQALATALLAEPTWLGMDTAAAAIGLESNTLLHAGPHFNNVSEIPAPIMNSACVAAVYEGLSNDFNHAQCMIEGGDIFLKPAQDHSIVTPLAAVVSASMPLHHIGGNDGKDGMSGVGSVYAPINGGSRPSLRLGLCNDAVLNHIRWLNSTFAQRLRGSPVAMIAMVARWLPTN